MSDRLETITSVGAGSPFVALPPAAGRGRDRVMQWTLRPAGSPYRAARSAKPLSPAPRGAGARCRLLGAGGAVRPMPMRSEFQRGQMTRDTRRISTQSSSGFGR